MQVVHLFRFGNFQKVYNLVKNMTRSLSSLLHSKSATTLFIIIDALGGIPQSIIALLINLLPQICALCLQLDGTQRVVCIKMKTNNSILFFQFPISVCFIIESSVRLFVFVHP